MKLFKTICTLIGLKILEISALAGFIAILVYIWLALSFWTFPILWIIRFIFIGVGALCYVGLAVLWIMANWDWAKRIVNGTPRDC